MGWSAAIEQPIKFFWLSMALITILVTIITYLGVGQEVRLIEAVYTRTRELSEANAALQDSEARLNLVFDAVPALISFLDSDLRFVYANQEYERWFGVPGRRLIGRTLAELLGEAAYHEVEPKLQAALSGQPVSFEREQEFPLGGRRAVRVLYTPHVVADEVRGVFVLVEDLTEHKRAEAEVLRTAKLESIGVLAGGIAHDFNNLLTAMLGNLSLAGSRLRSSDAAGAAEVLGEAETATRRARGLTQQLLTFSKGGLPVKRVLSLGDLLHETTRFTLRGTSTRGEVCVEPDLAPVEADEDQLSQVIQNLLINAQQAMAGGGEIVVSAENAALAAGNPMTLPPGAYVKITVTDDGVGIPPENLPKIFDPYFTTKDQGSGLGLAAAYSIVRNHGGAISAASDGVPGRGTTFTIYLPAQTPLPTEGGRPHKVAPAPASVGATLCGRPPSVGPARVLIMDDEEMVRLVGARMLQMEGHQVETAANGEAAVEMFRLAHGNGRPFDVVIVDLTVQGGMGGLDTLEALRLIDPAVRVIVSSGYSTDPVMADFERYGFVGVVPKPYRIEQICGAVRHVREQEDAGASPAALDAD